jgi:flagellar assembly factor FliW
VRFESIRFGTLEVEDARVLEFPFGLAGLEGRRWALVEGPAVGPVRWLHSVEHPALALPLVEPERYFPDFSLVLSEEDREQIGAGTDAPEVYVTVRVAPDGGLAANLQAPLLVLHGTGYQVINADPAAARRAPLPPLAPAPSPSADGALPGD